MKFLTLCGFCENENILVSDEYSSYDSIMPERCQSNGLYIEAECPYYSYFEKQLVQKGLTFSDTIKRCEVLSQAKGLQKSEEYTSSQLDDNEEVLGK